jgi:carbonic anhydrase
MTRILQGVLDFQRRVFGGKKELFEKLAEGQAPLALFITCSDSRVSPDLLAQTQPGELFMLRNAGNIVPPYGVVGGGEDATIEYAIAVLRVRDVIVCGHTRCGAVHGLLAPGGLAKLPSVAKWVEHSRPILERVGEGNPEDLAFLTRAVEQNVLLQLEHLHSHPAVKAAIEARTLRMRGWVYDFEQGQVTVYDPVQGAFVPLSEHLRQKLLADADKSPRTIWDTRG